MMKRPLFLIGVSFACATWCAFFCSLTTALLISGMLAATGVFLQLLGKPRLRGVSLLLLSGALAMGNYALYAARSIAPFAAVAGQQVEIHGIVLAQSGTGRSATYTLLADFPTNPELPQKQRVVLRSYGEAPAKIGEGLRCVALVRLPEDTLYRSYYRSRGVGLLADLRGTPHLADVRAFAPQLLLLRLRQDMRENLYRNLPGDAARIVGAMVLGLADEVPSETFTAVNRSGTSHLLAVSGLHLSILTAFVLGALRRTPLPKPAQNLLAILAALLFAGLVGFSASIMRAFLMTAMMLLAGSFSRKSDSMSTLGLALLLLCLVCPYWTLGKGLWLSAGSTLGIILFSTRLFDWLLARTGRQGKLAGRFLRSMLGAVAVSLSAYVFSLPILLLSTGWISLISPLANMLVSPFITPLILGGIGCALLAGGGIWLGILSALTNFCVEMVVEISTALSRLPFSTFSMDEGYYLILLVGVAAGIGVLLAFKADKKLVAYALALALLCGGVGSISLAAAEKDTVELAVIDRCGTALLIRGDEAVLLGAPSHYTITRLERYLDFRGIQWISAVIAPDFPEQVDSALLRLSQQYGIGCIIGPDDAYILSMLEAALPEVQVFSGGYATTNVLGGVRIETPPSGEGMVVRIGGHFIRRGAAAQNPQARGEILLLGDAGVLAPGYQSAAGPVGRQLFGEVRIILRVG